MLFIPENELEKALVRAVKDPGTAPDFYRLLLSSDLLVLGSVEGHETDTTAFNVAPGSRISLVTGARNGSQYLPIFSSLPRMQDYVKEESKYLSINGRDLLDFTRGAPVILNPASEYGKELTADQIRQLLDGMGPQIRIGAGRAAYPSELVKMLTGLFATRADIETAWMIQATFADRGGEPHPVIGIETNCDWPTLMQEIQAAAEKSVPGLVFDVQRVDRYSPAGFTGAFLKAEPFYRRSNLN